MLQYELSCLEAVSKAKVYERTCDVAIWFSGSKEDVLGKLLAFQYDSAKVPAAVTEHSGRELNRKYQEKIMGQIALRAGMRLFLPMPCQCAYTVLRSLKYVSKGIRSLSRRKLEVAVLDAVAISVSILRGNLNTAGSIMFLLGLGETLEEWTHKKSVDDLAKSMSLNVDMVWVMQGDRAVTVPASQVLPGDLAVVQMGSMIPFDGIVTDGEAMVNQASFTGEPLPVKKEAGGYVYAGTIVEEGELTFQVKEVSGSTRYEKIVTMIEESEKLKSSLESKAEHLADKLVPYTLLGTALVWLFTRNTTKALSVLMVDFSCALKLAMPVSVLSAIREASTRHISIKGGKYLEMMAEAETIVLDKTGTLTKAKPAVKKVVTFGSGSEDEMLRIAACLEEHFPHSMAKAVVREAKARALEHEEMHSKVEYIVAHGISSRIDGKKAVIGSYHFIFEDEDCIVAPEDLDQFEALPIEYSHLYLAIENRLRAVICIEDPLREEAADVIAQLKKSGIPKVVMMTGDSERTAAAIAKKVGADEYHSEVLPEDKARFIEGEKAAGRRVIMVGDGINDSPALSAADVGIAISDGAEIAREIADITIAADDLSGLLTLRALSQRLMKRIRTNYRIIVGFNAALILMGVTGAIQPASSAFLHNMSTLGIGIWSMGRLLPADPEEKTGQNCR